MMLMLSRLVCSKNNLFFAFLVAGYIFDVILYDYIDFTSADELMALFLLFFSGLIINERRNIKEMIPLFVVLIIFLFYTTYSFSIHSNIPNAILKDLLIQIKPFLAFYCTYLIAPSFTTSQKRLIVVMCLTSSLMMLGIGLSNGIFLFFGHQSYFAKAIIATAFLYLYCCSDNWEDMLVFILILCIGFFSTRAKFYGFCGIAIFLILLYKAGIEIKFNISGCLIAICVLAIAVWLGKDKIILYYVDGMMNSREMWSRPAMLLTSLRIFIDYIPFGCGLASFASFVSGEYYSSIYEAYGISHLWGISKSNPAYVADAYYPVLAQFGIIGVGLYVYFWIWVVFKGIKLGNYGYKKEYLLILLSAIFFAIEGVADATFSQNRGLFILIITAMTVAKYKDLCLNKVEKGTF